jgi:hypothetical protein
MSPDSLSRSQIRNDEATTSYRNLGTNQNRNVRNITTRTKTLQKYMYITLHINVVQIWRKQNILRKRFLGRLNI